MSSLTMIDNISRKQVKVPASPQQEGIWFHTVANKSTAYWNFILNRSCNGALDIVALKKAVELIMERHSVLKSQLVIEGDKLYSTVSNLTSLDEVVEYKKFEKVSSSSIENLVVEEIIKAEKYEFDYTKEKMIRVKVLEFSTVSYIILNINHLMTDSVSMQIFWKELNEIYFSYVNKNKIELPVPQKQYADYCQEFAKFKSSETYSEQMKNWSEKLSNKAPNLDLSFYRTKSEARVHKREFDLSAEIVKEIRFFALKKKVIYPSVFLTAYFILLHKYSSKNRIVIGNIVNGRAFNKKAYSSSIGLFADVLVNLLEIQQDDTLLLLLKKVSSDVIDGLRTNDVIYEEVLRDFNKTNGIKPLTKPFYRPLYDNTFNLINDQDLFGSPQNFIKTKLHGTKVENAYFDVGLTVFDKGENAVIKFKVNCDDLFLPMADLLLENFLKILKLVIYNPTTRVIDVDLFSQGNELNPSTTDIDNSSEKTVVDQFKEGDLLSLNESKMILEDFNPKAIIYSKDYTVLDLFEKQVLKSSDSIAVVFGNIKMSYSELNEKSNQLANYLVNIGVESESLIGICIERSIEMIIGILGVIKAGGAYVPIDPNYPNDRIAFILKDCETDVVLGSDKTKESLNGFDGNLLLLDKHWEEIAKQSNENLSRQPQSKDLIYVMYTLDFERRPKGVMIEHQSVVSLLTGLMDKYQMSSSERVLLFTNYVFDASVAQIFLALLSGCKLFIIENKSILNEVEFVKFVAENEITHLDATPSYLSAIDPSALNSLKRVIFRGEYLSKDLFTKYKKFIPIVVNEYGPTEATITTMVSINSYQLNNSPIVNTSLYLLDSNQKLVPIGAAGEIYIGGVQVARGYLNLPEMDAKRFLDDPFNNLPGSRVYRTGNLGRWLPDGSLEFLGRINGQVELRGTLIELGKIESALSQVEGIRQCCVLLRNKIRNSEKVKYFVGYYVPESNALTKEFILNKFTNLLPDYMIPNVFFALDSFPYTPSGKLDKSKLLDLDFELSGKEHIPPKTELEVKVCNIYSEVLGIASNKISMKDVFFEMGGNSILAMQVLNKLTSEFDCQINADDVFKYKTIGEIANFLTQILSIKHH